MNRHCLRTVMGITSLVLFAAADWPQFRGPASQGSATDAKPLPTEWSSTENLLWQAKLPGPGASSPLVLGDRIYVTCYSGYGQSTDEAGAATDLVRHLLCLNRADGKTLWQQEIKTSTPEADFRGMMTQHGYASHTPATDGERLYLFVGSGGVWAFDLTGKKLWNTSVGEGSDGWGSASSVVLAGDLVIVNAAIESDAVVGLKKATGEEVWRFKTKGRSWSTPAVVKSADGKAELVVSVEGRISGLDPATGKELWFCDGIKDYTCPSVTAGDGVAYIAGGRQSKIMAVKTGGQGDVTDTHKLWEKVLGGNVTTPALAGEYLYGVSDRSIAYCVKAATGEIMYNQRLPSAPGAVAAAAPPPAAEPAAPAGGRPPLGPPGGRGRFGRGGGGGGMERGLYASVIVADGKVYAVTRTGGTFVLAAAPELKLLAVNKLSDETRFDATASVAGDQLLLRSNQSLYCLGKK